MGKFLLSRRLYGSWMGISLCWLLVVAPVRAQSPEQKLPEFRVDLVSSVDSIASDMEFEVALKFWIEEDWHMYWKNSGDSGMPPQVRWDLPEGFTVSPLEFPVPERHNEGADLVTNIHQGEPILIAKIRSPKELPDSVLQPAGESGPGQAVLSAKVQALVCKKQCLQMTRTLRATLPVSANRDAVKPDHADLFESARRLMPKPASQATYVKLSPSVSVESIQPKSSFELILALDIQKGMHIQSDRPLNEYLIATDNFLENTPGLTFGKPQYPEPKIRTMYGDMKVAEFEGSIEIRYPVETDNTLDEGPFRIAGILRYQACNEQGRCFAPENLSWHILVPVENAEGAEVGDVSVVPSARSDNGGAEIQMETAVSVVSEDSEQDVSAGHLELVGEEAAKQEHGLVYYLLAAMLGGLILNVMPCVLPVISVKILSFVQQASESRKRVFQLGLAFASGIVVSFMVLAVIVILLKNLGASVGWGFQLANPYAVIILSGIIFLFGLSLVGVFEFNLPGRVSQQFGAVDTREGLTGSFMKGVLATVLATPCTAPALGAAIGYAFQQPAGTILLIMLCVGLGMAIPYVLLTAEPRWLKFLPKPGPWMEKFKQLMGFILFGTVVWLLLILGDLLDAGGIVWTLSFLCFLALAAWMIGSIHYRMSRIRQWAVWGGSAAVVGLGWTFSYVYAYDIEESRWDPGIAAKSSAVIPACDLVCEMDYADSIPWQPWSPGIAGQLANQGYTVYVDYTATWCATCQFNKKTVLETEAVRRKMDELDVIPIKADFTKQQPEILAELERYGRSGVPLNIIVPAYEPDDTIVLPELLGSTRTVIEQLEQAGPSKSMIATALTLP